jgi:hypothetical protein
MRPRINDVYPNVGALAGTTGLGALVGALLTVVLVVAVLMIVICSVAWAIGHSTGSWQMAARARAGLWVALGAAALAGAGVAWVNFLIGVGTTV